MTVKFSNCLLVAVFQQSIALLEYARGVKITKKRRWLLTLFLLIMQLQLLTACGKDQSVSYEKTGLTLDHTLSLTYAKQFQVDYFEEGYTIITIAGSDTYLLVPEGKAVPDHTDGMTVLQQPIDNIYMVSSSAMDLVRAVGGLSSVTMTGTKDKDWYLDDVKTAMNEGKIVFAGKYSAPDYEMILSNQCGLAVENTMIYHKPEVKEKLTELGIPVLVEYSSMEKHPLGRVEWIKLYGVLLGKEAEAEAFFSQATEQLSEVMGQENTGKTVAYFYITPTDAVNVRKSGDYIAEMIELSGGKYVFEDLTDDNALSTMNIQMEEFVERAMEADYLVYNSTIDGTLPDVEALLQKCPELKNAKAVREGHVWCTEKNMFQETTGIAEMILDFHAMLTGSERNFRYLYRLEDE